MVYKFERGTPYPMKGSWKIDDTIVMPTGAEYLCADAEPYRRKVTRKETLVLEWLGKCDNCGCRYSFKTGQTTFAPMANCPNCRDSHSPNDLRGALARRLNREQARRDRGDI